MPYPPAKCRQCAAVFEARGSIRMGGRSQVTVAGTMFRPCPFCGGTCDLLDGTYTVVDGVISLLRAPQVTLDVLIAAGLAFADAKARGESNDEALKQAETVMPSLARWDGAARKTLMWALALVAALGAERYVINPALDTLDEYVRRLIACTEAATLDRANLDSVLSGRPEPGTLLNPASTLTLQLARQLKPARPEIAKAIQQLERDASDKKLGNVHQ